MSSSYLLNPSQEGHIHRYTQDSSFFKKPN